MTREQKYTQQLRELGVYHPAFDPAIHTLAMMEREHQRTVKLWKASGSRTGDPVYEVIERQRRDILSHRDALGLTPKGLKRLKPAGPAPEASGRDGAKENVLELIRARFANEG